MTNRPDAGQLDADLPQGIGRVAARELVAHGITSCATAATHTSRELLGIHGVGPKAVAVLRAELATRGLHFVDEQSGATQQTVVSPPVAPTPRIFRMPFANVYPLYVAKAERKGRSQADVDQIICWLTGYTNTQLTRQVARGVDMETFFRAAPKPQPFRDLITGVVCGVRVEEVTDPVMREIRYVDKLVDELAKGKAMEKILRTPST